MLLRTVSRQLGRRPLNCPRASQAGFQARGLATAGASPFDWQDPLRWQTLLTEEEVAISETAEAYCQEKLQPRVLGTNSPRTPPLPPHSLTAR
jgi:glutaryl-CoA dehydrogenase